MPAIGVIGGTGLTSLEGLEILGDESVGTRWGEPSGPVIFGRLAGVDIAFLARHGAAHTIPPHRVNYRANVSALREVGVNRVIAVAAVGGIAREQAPGVVGIPDQLIDYTWARGHTFFEEDLSDVVHVDFSHPYCSTLRGALIDGARELAIGAVEGGTYGVTQGPRLETAAEIDRMERDGCDIVGMTGLPEAALARELEISYAHCTVVANRAAGRSTEPLTMEVIRGNLEAGMARVRRLLAAVLPVL